MAGEPAEAGGGTDDSLCLVTGATGFIGGHLTERLVNDGHRVRCLARRTSDTERLEQLGVERVYGDLTNSASLLEVAQGCRFVLHCGALVSDWATVAEMRRINVAGTRHLLEASIAASVERFIHFSTTDIYGHPGGRAIDETYVPSGFRNWYAQTKLEAERVVLETSQRASVSAVIL